MADVGLRCMNMRQVLEWARRDESEVSLIISISHCCFGPVKEFALSYQNKEALLCPIDR